MKTVEAIIETNGEVHLVEPIRVSSPRRALVTILEEAPAAHDAADLGEEVRRRDELEGHAGRPLDFSLGGPGRREVSYCSGHDEGVD